MKKYFFTLLCIVAIVSCKLKEPSIYDLFADKYLNDPSKYEFIDADTIEFWELLAFDEKLGIQYGNFETVVQRASDLIKLEASINNLEQNIQLADSLLNLKSDIVFQGNTQNQLELQAQFEGIQNRIKIEKSKLESLLDTYDLNNPNLIMIKHKYRTLNNDGNLIIEESILAIDTITNELIRVAEGTKNY